jgi:hypothetical protein
LAFAFDAILVSFMARQPPCPVCYLQVGILPKTAGGCRAFFARQTSRIKKWVVFRDLSQDFGDIVAAASQIDLDDLPSTVNGVTDALKVIIDVAKKMQSVCRRAKKDMKRLGSFYWSKLDAWDALRRAV